ncbi:MAG: class I SAM-dependent methyltransferase [Candidatus Ancaeobacter aquaticus]|nr:class I SAM-dependent methyltransferase [Candidatus Ancaeobacter aquaticus]
MLTYIAYLKKLNNFTPTVYDITDEHPDVNPKYSHRAYSGSKLYYECYKNIAHDVKDGTHLLDIGAYPGTFLRLCKDIYFNKKQMHLTGTGLILPEDEENYRSKARKFKNIKCIQSDLGFKDYFLSEGIDFISCELDYCFNKENDNAFNERFDIVTCMEVIEHLHTPYKLINTIKSCLKPGGVCFLETNNVHNINGIIKLLFSRKSNLDPELVERYIPDGYTTKRPHIRFYSIHEICYLLKKAGFIIEKSYSFNWDIPPQIISSLKNILSLSTRNIFPLLFAGKRTHIAIKARKK